MKTLHIGVYPRVCGGTIPQLAHPTESHRSIPACAGEPDLDLCAECDTEVYPACAGEPGGRAKGGTTWRVYPRVCGGTNYTSAYCPLSKGLSPRVRGNHAEMRVGQVGNRSIPACAGEPRKSDVARRRCAVYPACAGEPSPSVSRARESTVYPRVCGGTAVTPSSGVGVVGLSPRVRGNLPPWELATQSAAVYPRVCGGTHVGAVRRRGAQGLSPRCAGEPCEPPVWTPTDWVYPRVCGGTAETGNGQIGKSVYPRVCGGTNQSRALTGSVSGLSPRVRGNPLLGTSLSIMIRSIPACAGEPRTAGRPSPMNTVYPRVCGGTGLPTSTSVTAKGLSPRVRGNHSAEIRTMPWLRSIPACAGEPL